MVPVCSLTGPFSLDFSCLHSIEDWACDYPSHTLCHNQHDDRPFSTVHPGSPYPLPDYPCMENDFWSWAAYPNVYLFLYRRIVEPRMRQGFGPSPHMMFENGVSILQAYLHSGRGTFGDLFAICPSDSHHRGLSLSLGVVCRNMGIGFYRVIYHLLILVLEIVRLKC